MLTIPYPAIDPTLIHIGPLAVRWYALAYIAGLLLGWRYCLALAKKPPHILTALDVDDFLVWATLGVVLGGRTGYVLFYKPGYYAAHPLEIFQLWHGGMSFHGGATGVVAALALFCRQRKIDFRGFGDILVCAVPIGLFFGRLANFINGELFGRPASVPWAMVFPTDELQLPRHPSQLYEAFLEGAVLFTLLFVLQHFTRIRERRGVLAGIFLIGYGMARITVECFREPDPQLMFLYTDYGISMGQILSLPLVALGGLLIWLARRRPAAA